MNILDYFNRASNIYRTNNYIVCQFLYIKAHEVIDNALFSSDVYFKRTRKRDRYYEKLNEAKVNIDGVRIPTNLYTRQYID